jgi:hypothetical protein
MLYNLYIKSHCELPDYEDETSATSLEEAAQIFQKKIGADWTPEMLMEYISEDGTDWDLEVKQKRIDEDEKQAKAMEEHFTKEPNRDL